MAGKVPFAGTAASFLHSLVYRKLGESLLGGSRRRESSEVCQVMIGLMQDLQLHRGLSGAVLDGQTDFTDELDAVEQKLSRSLYALSEHHGDHHPILRHAQWQTVIDDWKSARVNWRDLDFYTNLFLHNEIIDELVGVLQILSANFGSHLCEQHSELIKRWPLLIEQLGVLRALGLHLLTYRDSRSDQRVENAMRDYLGYAFAELERMDATNANPLTLDATHLVLNRVERLLRDQRASLTPHDYYDAMTDVIDAWYHDLRRQVAAYG